MYDKLIADLKDDAEWAEANEWETPICLSDHIKQAIEAIEFFSNRLCDACGVCSDDKKKICYGYKPMTEHMSECCNTCRHSYKLEKCDYSHGGCEHTSMGGYICMAFANERIACWMVGLDDENNMCECYEEKK